VIAASRGALSPRDAANRRPRDAGATTDLALSDALADQPLNLGDLIVSQCHGAEG